MLPTSLLIMSNESGINCFLAKEGKTIQSQN
jgi:hypothetical protein